MGKNEKRGLMSLLFGGQKAAGPAPREEKARRSGGSSAGIVYARHPEQPPKRCVVFDLETTDRDSTVAEIVEIGAVKYINGKAVDSFETLVRPTGKLSPFASRVNGITDAMVATAPPIQRVLPSFLRFADGFALVTYNGFTFDFKVLDRIGRSLGLPINAVGYDVYQDAKTVLTRPQSHKLEYLRKYYGLEGQDHRALDDAITTWEVWKICFPSLFPESARRARWADSRPAPPVPPRDPHQIFRGQALPYRPDLYPSRVVSGPGSPFWQKQCVITGELHITRPEAEALIEKAGGIVKSSVSRGTDYLIVGKQDVALVGEDGMSTKQERAEAINASGSGSIRMLTERQFCAMLSAPNR